ncbi:MAG: phosphoglycerate kinase [Bacteroidia bacterium]|nr:phosphoglycerate kinase [Bacteroidia bacterium]MDW8088360.1 phosphoglycerate kinase [Bacteroidia bacterium]
MTRLPSLRQAALQGRRVFARVDFNVPTEGELITDDRRIRAALPTIEYLLGQGAGVILCSHFGRPKAGRPESRYSLQIVRRHLENLLQRPVGWIADPFTPFPVAPGSIYLMENIRFFPGETENDPHLAQALAAWADVYVNDAFGALHRAHASVEALPRLFREKYAGFLVEAEWQNAQRVLQVTERPYLIIVGGAKVSDKLPLLENLLPRADRVLIGGGMSYTFLKAAGRPIGRSLVEAEQVEAARNLLAQAHQQGKTVGLPVDAVAAETFSADAVPHIFPHEPGAFPETYMGLDIGPATIELARRLIQGSRTILWNGPMGVFEWPAFRAGTQAVAEAVAAETTQHGAYSLIGGGDTAAAVEMAGVADQVSFISTGGGALLELLAGQTLPGLAVLLA